MGKTGALASGTNAVVVASHGGAVAVVHGRTVNAAGWLLIAGIGVSAAASGTATTPPPVSPSTTTAAGGTSGSCIHIFSLFLFFSKVLLSPPEGGDWLLHKLIMAVG